MKPWSDFVVRTLADLGDDVTLAPERHRTAGLVSSSGVPLSSLVVERGERVVGAELASALVLDTTHVKDGVIDVAAAARTAVATSAKKRARAGDLLVSRLRPYLRQIALVTADVERACEGRALACSTEFYVLAPRDDGAGLGFLLPWLLGDEAQAILASAQEGGHHPRVPRETVLAMRVPRGRVERREEATSDVESALERFYEASERLRASLGR